MLSRKETKLNCNSLGTQHREIPRNRTFSTSSSRLPQRWAAHGETYLLWPLDAFQLSLRLNGSNRQRYDSGWPTWSLDAIKLRNIEVLTFGIVDCTLRAVSSGTNVASAILGPTPPSFRSKALPPRMIPNSILER